MPEPCHQQPAAASRAGDSVVPEPALPASPADLVAMERLAVHAWPATETAAIDGWLWRWSGGGSQRANSVATVDYVGGDVERTIAEVESRYAAKGVSARFQLFEASRPGSLGACLARRGYAVTEECTTLWKPVDAAAVPPADVVVGDRTDEAWLDVYLAAQTASRQVVNRGIVARVPGPRVLASCWRDGRVVSTGLGVAMGSFVIIECMATRPEARRQGGAEAVLRAIEAWAAALGARHLFLQATAANAPAQSLYRRFGMTLAGRYSFHARA